MIILSGLNSNMMTAHTFMRSSEVLVMKRIVAISSQRKKQVISEIHRDSEELARKMDSISHAMERMIADEIASDKRMHRANLMLALCGFVFIAFVIAVGVMSVVR